MTPKKIPQAERRQYIRLDSVFPVQFRLISLDGNTYLSDWLQGFTNNIGKGGICLQINTISAQLSGVVLNCQAKLFIEIEIPFIKKPILAQAKITWAKELSQNPQRYLLGLTYENIEAQNNARLMRYVRSKKMFIPLVLGAVIILGLLICANIYINSKLTRGNRKLVEQLVAVLQEASFAKQKIIDITQDKKEALSKMNSLMESIRLLDQEKARLYQEYGSKEGAAQQKLSELNSAIEALKKERYSLREKVNSSLRRESAVSRELVNLDEKKTVLEKANIDKMYQWLSVHQNLRTGLVMSFEGDTEIANWAFIYDQSLAAQAYLYFSDFERARKIMDFFLQKAKRIDGLFVNAYYADDGSPAEYTLHCGPNIWMGLAAVHYTRKTKDARYLPLAEDIARAVMNFQDDDGGIRGGPKVAWYSTEHNLDAYAFFDMLYQVTGKMVYRQTADKVLNWLVRHTYDKLDVPILRGKGDSTIATDTYAWSIAAIGPGKLASLGMDPVRIVEFAENNCSVEVSYNRAPGQSIKIKGFDFAPQRHVARGGVVSSEWTAQMVVTFKIMSDYYQKQGNLSKSAEYKAKANSYLSELFNMLISSPSPSGQGEGCLPYASSDFVDTGHGWMTPKGKSTGSVSGTVYAIFAYYNYNPLGS